MKFLRISRGFKQEEVAEAVGVSGPTISIWERSSHPPLPAIEKVCQLYKITLSDFFASEGSEESSFPYGVSRSDLDRIAAIENLPDKERYILNQIIDLFIAENRAPRWRVD